MFDLEALSKAILWEREQEARRLSLPLRPRRRRPSRGLRARLARRLVLAGLHLDRQAGEAAYVRVASADDPDGTWAGICPR